MKEILVTDAIVRPLFPPRKRDLHKGECGTAAIVAGTSSLGASVLSALACLKSGAGYTKFYAEGDPLPFVLRMPACIVRALDEEELLHADAIAFGMGAGTGRATYDLTCRLLASFSGTLVLDADALNSLARYGLSPLEKRRCSLILTPHPLEFSRLSGLDVREISENRIAAAENFAKKYAVTLALKGHETVTTDGSVAYVNTTGSPCLAKGGSGDVLAGFLAGSAARGLPPLEAAVAASYVLGRAAELCARRMGEYSPDATDVISEIGAAILSLQS